jgi:hypothetical protein
MFATVDLEGISNKVFIGMCMIFAHVKFHTPKLNGALVISVRQKAGEQFGNPQEEKRQPLEAATKQRLVKTEKTFMCTVVTVQRDCRSCL